MNGDGRLLGLAAAVLLVVAGLFVADHDAWTPDEPRVAELCRSVASGSWVVPRLNGEAFLEQPPFHEWCVAGAYGALGTSPAAARAVSALAGLLALAVTFLLGERLGGRRVGALAALSCGLSFGFAFTTHRIVCDGVLTLWVAFSGYASLRGLTSTGRARVAWLLLAYALASLAFLTKNVVGVGLAGFGFVAVVVAQRDPRQLLRAHLWAAPLVFALVAGPYLVQLWLEMGPEGVRELLVTNVFGRALGTGAKGHDQPPYYYLVQLPVTALPTFLAFVGGALFYARRRRELAAEPRFAFEVALAWVALGVLALSCARSKRELYLVPLFPAVGVVSGLWLDRVLEGEDRSLWARLVPRVAVGAAGALGLALLGASAGLVLGGSALPPELGFVQQVPAALLLLAAVPALAAGIGGAVVLGRGRTGAALAAVLVGALGAGALVLRAVVPVVDELKTLGPAVRAACALVPPDRALYLYEADETVRAAVPFYGGRPGFALGQRNPDGSVRLADRDELRAHVSGERTVFVLVVEKRGDALQLGELRGLEPEVLYELVRPGSRSVRLVRIRR